MQRDMKFAPDVNSGGMYLSRRKKAGMFAHIVQPTARKCTAHEGQRSGQLFVLTLSHVIMTVLLAGAIVAPVYVIELFLRAIGVG